MAGAIRRQAKKAGSKIAAGAKVVGFWAKRGAQFVKGARLSARVMEKVPAPARPGSVNTTRMGDIARLHASRNEIEINRGRNLMRYDAEGRRIQSTHIGRGDRVVTEKRFKPAALLPYEVRKRFQKR